MLHTERLTDSYNIKNRKKRTHKAAFQDLPNGSFVLLEERPYLVCQAALLPWTPVGYEAPISRSGEGQVDVLTPPSTVAALAQGYVPSRHESARM